MPGRVLHLLSQRPSRTGSGVTLDAMVREASVAGWQQAAVVGAPISDNCLEVGDLPFEAVYPVHFAGDQPTGTPDLDFPVPGMSDVMPYPSTVWSTMTTNQLERYRAVWTDHLSQVVARFSPDIIHSHHIWLMSSLLKGVAPDIPVVLTCHSTGLRQMTLTPHLADEVRRGCAGSDHFCVLRQDHGDLLRDSLGVSPAQITVTGAGYRPDLFHHDSTVVRRPTDILYIGKYSHAKGLPWLLNAFQNLAKKQPDIRLHIAGDGAGPEAELLRQRMRDLAPAVVLHGQLNQPELAGLMQRCGVCVLPSFYEGVPLVLVEAAACGCRLVATSLPGVTERIQPHLAGRLDLVPMPRLLGVDQPLAEDLPRLVSDLTATLDQAIGKAVADSSPAEAELLPFTWAAVFGRIEKIWHRLMAETT